MKNILISLIISVAAGLGITTWSTQENVSACIHAPGCVEQESQPKGKITTVKNGFPSPYRTTVKFEPENNNPNSPDYAGYAEAKATTQNLSPLLALSNILICFAIINPLLRIVQSRLSDRTTPKASA